MSRHHHRFERDYRGPWERRDIRPSGLHNGGANHSCASAVVNGNNRPGLLPLPVIPSLLPTPVTVAVTTSSSDIAVKRGITAAGSVASASAKVGTPSDEVWKHLLQLTWEPLCVSSQPVKVLFTSCLSLWQLLEKLPQPGMTTFLHAFKVSSPLLYFCPPSLSPVPPHLRVLHSHSLSPLRPCYFLCSLYTVLYSWTTIFLPSSFSLRGLSLLFSFGP